MTPRIETPDRTFEAIKFASLFEQIGAGVVAAGVVGVRPDSKRQPAKNAGKSSEMTMSFTKRGN